MATDFLFSHRYFKRALWRDSTGRIFQVKDMIDRGSGCRPQPDFARLDAAAPESAARRTFLLALIGNLSFAWSNNESLFIHIIRTVLQVDETSAVIVFATLNNARSRVELVERLGRAKIIDRSLRREFERLLARFNEATRVRNEFNHCLYLVDDNGCLTHTQSLRIRDNGGVQGLERPSPLDESRISLLMSAAEDLKNLNRAIWKILPRLEAHLSSRPPHE